jgi:hypothetical protein
MIHLSNNKKNNPLVTVAATLFMLATIVVVVAAGAATILTTTIQSAEAVIDTNANTITNERLMGRAPVVVSGGNIYVAWWTNNTANNNEEVMFRASNDGGATFGDKMNLSNSPDADSWRVETAAEGADVVVTWWETNQTSDTPVARISADGGQIFGPVLRLAPNGTITE